MSPDQTQAILARLDSQADQLDRIEQQVLKTNGRVTDLEISRATERGAALQRAATIEDVRQVRASDLARAAWVKPGVVAVACTLLGVIVAHFFGS